MEMCGSNSAAARRLQPDSCCGRNREKNQFVVDFGFYDTKNDISIN